MPHPRSDGARRPDNAPYIRLGLPGRLLWLLGDDTLRLWEQFRLGSRCERP